MKERALIEVGKKVRDFILKDHHGEEFNLSFCRGKKVLLSFHPLAWTSICATQMKDLEKNRKTLEKLNTMAVGISVDSVPCKAAWAESLKIKNTPLLSDFWPHGKLARYFGIFDGEKGFSKRANVIIDEKGRVMFVKVYPLKEVPDIEEIIGVLS